MNEQMLKRLYILNFGLFQVHENGRLIGIPGYLLQTHDGRNILVDSGFPAAYAHNAEQATRDDGLGSFGRVVSLTEENLPAGQLGKIGLREADIDSLVLTHSDIDHVGGIGNFPGVPIVVHAAERAFAEPRYWNGRSPIPWPNNPYQLVDHDQELCPGVTLLTTPGHAPGHLSLLLHLPQTGPVLLTADAISRPAELVEGYGGAVDQAQARASGERLMAIARQHNAFVIYGHDPAQWPTLRKAPSFYA